ncbi:Putative uncharacterized protein [Moritella viscosa]|nr:Putative uncharacterized protein [Moritella viscosa]SHO28172.1 Putative uncharacterized protein [Moritella viscosa]
MLTETNLVFIVLQISLPTGGFFSSWDKIVPERSIENKDDRV